jgi:hypothetical protein
MKRLFLVLLGLAALTACVPPPPPNPAKVAPVADLVTVFDRLALGLGRSDNAKGRALKWVTPISIRLQDANSPSDRTVVREAFDEVAATTGISWKFAEKGQKPNFFVRFVAKKDVYVEVAKLRGGLDKTRGLPETAICYAQPLGTININAAHILIASNMGNDVRNICVLHEIMHAFGLIGHHRVFAPSILYHTDMSRQGFSVNDKIVLRTLYDARIHAGMKREDALPVATEIIRDFVSRLAETKNADDVLNQPLKH